MTPSSTNIGHSDLLFTIQIDVQERSNYPYRPWACSPKCANVPPKFTKKAQKLHLMTPIPQNIGHSDLFLLMQIRGLTRIDYQHRPLGYGYKCLHMPLTHRANRLKYALDDPISLQIQVTVTQFYMCLQSIQLQLIIAIPMADVPNTGQTCHQKLRKGPKFCTY